MTIDHSLLTDPALHEPKGVGAAAKGSVYIATGGGTGVQTVVFDANNEIVNNVTTASTSNTLPSSGVVQLSTSPASPVNYLLPAPTSGCKLTLVLTVGSTSNALTITLASTSNSIAGAKQCITPVNILGTALILEGLSNSLWAIIGSNSSIRVKTS